MPANPPPPPELSPWRLGGLSVRQLLGELWTAANDDDILGRAGQLAYAFLFSLFPLLVFLLAVLGTMAGPGSSMRAHLVDTLTRAMPGSASSLVRQSVNETLKASGGGKLSFGIILGLFSASSGVSALMDTLNSAYAVKEGRSILRVRIIALVLTVALAVLIIVALAIVLYGNTIVTFVADRVGLGSLATWAWELSQWPLAVFFLLLAFALIYYYGPDVAFPRWRWITPGSIAGVFLWLVVSFALRVYLHFFNTFSRTYGSLGAVIILLLWFYMTGLAVLVGGEVNAAIENAAARRGAPGAKRKGEKRPSNGAA